jgi:hypothetical protein
MHQYQEIHMQTSSSSSWCAVREWRYTWILGIGHTFDELLECGIFDTRQAGQLIVSIKHNRVRSIRTRVDIVARPRQRHDFTGRRCRWLLVSCFIGSRRRVIRHGRQRRCRRRRPDREWGCRRRRRRVIRWKSRHRRSTRRRCHRYRNSRHRRLGRYARPWWCHWFHHRWSLLCWICHVSRGRSVGANLASVCWLVVVSECSAIKAAAVEIDEQGMGQLKKRCRERVRARERESQDAAHRCQRTSRWCQPTRGS